MEGSAGVTAMDTSTAAAPVPERATVWGEVAAVSEKVSVPVLLPVVLGENVMPTVQERVAPIPEPQVLLAMAKLAEGAAIMLLKVRAELWLFVRLTVMAALVSPIGRLPKGKLGGLGTVAGVVGNGDFSGECARSRGSESDRDGATCALGESCRTHGTRAASALREIAGDCNAGDGERRCIGILERRGLGRAVGSLNRIGERRGGQGLRPAGRGERQSYTR